MNLREAAAEKGGRDRAEGTALIAMGIPFTIVALGGFSLLLFALLWFLRVPAGIALAVGVAVAVTAAVIDTLRHPEERWKVARYRLVDGTYAGPSDLSVALAMAGYVPTGLGGMPLTAAVSDPENLAAQGSMVVSGCSNVVLGGPRQLRRALQCFALARLRTDPRVLGEAEALLAWVAKNGPVEQEALGAEAARRHWISGLALLMDLNALRWTLENGVKRAVVREA